MLFEGRSKRGKGKINNSWGVRAYYKYYRQHRPKRKGWALDSMTFYAILRRTNQILADDLLKTGSVTFPCGLGGVKYMKSENGVYVKNNKLKTTRIINWKETMALWQSDDDAYLNKYFIYFETKDKPIVFYDKHNTKFINRVFYHFDVNKTINSAFLRQNASRFSELPAMYTKSEFSKIKGLYDG